MKVVLIALFALVGITGCSKPKANAAIPPDFELMRAEIEFLKSSNDAMRRQIESLQVSAPAPVEPIQGATKGQLSRLRDEHEFVTRSHADQIEALEHEVQSQNQRIEQNEAEIDALQARIADLEARLRRR